MLLLPKSPVVFFSVKNNLNVHWEIDLGPKIITKCFQNLFGATGLLLKKRLMMLRPGPLGKYNFFAGFEESELNFFSIEKQSRVFLKSLLSYVSNNRRKESRKRFK